MDLSNLVPITAVVAVGLFATKEWLEHGRRRDADLRKIGALKVIIARECELNYWTIKSLQRVLAEMISKGDGSEDYSFLIVEKASGQKFFRTINSDGSEAGQTWLPEVYRDVMSRNLVEIATLDKDIYAVVEEAHDAVAEIQHVRDQVLSMHDRPSFIDEESYLSSLVDYGTEELKSAKESIEKLYRLCTGKELVMHRLR